MATFQPVAAQGPTLATHVHFLEASRALPTYLVPINSGVRSVTFEVRIHKDDLSAFRRTARVSIGVDNSGQFAEILGEFETYGLGTIATAGNVTTLMVTVSRRTDADPALVALTYETKRALAAIRYVVGVPIEVPLPATSNVPIAARSSFINDSPSDWGDAANGQVIISGFAPQTKDAPPLIVPLVAANGGTSQDAQFTTVPAEWRLVVASGQVKESNVRHPDIQINIGSGWPANYQRPASIFFRRIGEPEDVELSIPDDAEKPDDVFKKNQNEWVTVGSDKTIDVTRDTDSIREYSDVVNGVLGSRESRITEIHADSARPPQAKIMFVAADGWAAEGLIDGQVVLDESGIARVTETRDAPVSLTVHEPVGLRDEDRLSVKIAALLALLPDSQYCQDLQLSEEQHRICTAMSSLMALNNVVVIVEQRLAALEDHIKQVRGTFDPDRPLTIAEQSELDDQLRPLRENRMSLQGIIHDALDTYNVRLKRNESSVPELTELLSRVQKS